MNVGDPVWTEKVEERDLAQDPLATNRVMNRLLRDLLPGITTISPRARYLSHHLWALRDIAQHVKPESRSEFLEEMYCRERVLLLASALHDKADNEETRTHRNIVGIERGREIINDETDLFTLDFRFLSTSGGSFGQAYNGPLKTLGLLTEHEESDFEVLTDQGSQVAQSYATLANSTGLVETVRQDSVTNSEIARLAPVHCLCQVCEPTAPDRSLLREVYLGELHPDGYETSAQARRKSLLLLLNFIQQLENDDNVGPGSFLDSCYFRASKTKEGVTPIEIPDHLLSETSQWKVLRAHDYLAFVSEVLLEAWLAYLESDESESTREGFKQKLHSQEVLGKLRSITGIETFDLTTPLSVLASNLWPDCSAQTIIEQTEIVPAEIADPMSEYTIDAALNSARSQEDRPTVYASWPCLILAVALRFSTLTGKDENAWAWMTSQTQQDLSPARLQESLKSFLSEGITFREFVEWFVDEYVILQAEKTRREKANDSIAFRGWFESQGNHYKKTRDYRASHWSTRFNSACSILRDLALLDPTPDTMQVTSDGLAALDPNAFGGADVS